MHWQLGSGARSEGFLLVKYFGCRLGLFFGSAAAGVESASGDPFDFLES